MTDFFPQSNLSTLAISAAIDLRWEDAIKLNKEILKDDSDDTDALNRLARAYFELGKMDLAKKFYTQALKYDPYNSIAVKNLKIIKAAKGANGYFTNGSGSKVSPSLFLQEPGKTKVVTLLKVAEPQKLSHTYPGMPVEMQIKNRRVTITDPSGSYLGILPDDLSHRLIRLVNGGNKYDSYIKSVRVNSLSVLIKETFRSKRFKNQPSFLEAGQSPTTSEIIHNIAEIEEGEDDNTEAETEEY